MPSYKSGCSGTKGGELIYLIQKEHEIDSELAKTLQIVCKTVVVCWTRMILTAFPTFLHSLVQRWISVRHFCTSAEIDGVGFE